MLAVVSAVTNVVTGDECCGVADEYIDDEDDNGGDVVTMAECSGGDDEYSVVAMMSVVW